jgi:hypothetical protein
MEGTKNLEKDLHKLEAKVKVQEETLKRKNQREEALLSELSLFEAKIQLK